MKNLRSMLPFLFVVFLDSIATGLTLTIVPPMLMKQGYEGFLITVIPLATRGFFCASATLCFTTGQLLCSSLLDYLSSQIGHKKTLLMLAILSITSYAIGVASLGLRSLALLFFFQFCAGVSTSGRPVLQIATTQAFPEQKKAKLYGWVGASGAVGFIIGSFITQLGIGNFPMLLRYTVFFGAAATLSCLNYFLILQLPQQAFAIEPVKKRSLQQSLEELKNLLQNPLLKRVFLLIFFYLIAGELFYTFAPLFFIRYFSIPAEHMTRFYTLVTFWSLIGNVVLGPKASRFSNKGVLSSITPIWVVFLFLLGLIHTLPLFWLGTAVISSLGAITGCTFLAFLSDQVDLSAQDAALGIAQGLQCLARLIPSLVLVSSLIQYPGLPIQGGALAFMLVALIHWKRMGVLHIPLEKNKILIKEKA